MHVGNLTSLLGVVLVCDVCEVGQSGRNPGDKLTHIYQPLSLAKTLSLLIIAGSVKGVMKLIPFFPSGSQDGMGLLGTFVLRSFPVGRLGYSWQVSLQNSLASAANFPWLYLSHNREVGLAQMGQGSEVGYVLIANVWGYF